MIPHALSGLSFVERFYSFPVISSTNDTARTLAHLPQKGIFCIQADRQTSGRGRREGPYFSDSPGGLWVSVMIPIDDIGSHFVYNRAISLAILLTLEQCGKGLPVSIKWPNDIYCDNRKICGILLESHQTSQNVLVIGFGLNVNIEHGDFPAELSQTATSVLIETGRRCSLTALLRTILKQFTIILASDREKVHAAYLARLLGKGRVITINGMTGTLSSVDIDGRLLLSDGGRIVPVSTGSPVFIEPLGMSGRQ